jgi:hypothetical protein
MSHPGSFKEAFIKVINRVYAPYSYDIIHDEFNGKTKEELAKKDPHFNKDWFALHTKRYYRSYIIMLASFLGLPTYCELGKRPTWGRIAKNFLGWHTVHTTNKSRRAITFAVIKNISRAFLFVPANTLIALVKFPLNLVKIFTELLPLTIGMSLGYAVYHVNKERIKQKHKVNKLHYHALNAAFAVLWGLKMAVLGMHFIGRAITSPMRGVLDAYQSGKNLNGDNRGGKFLGVLFAIASICVTVTVYAFLFPLAFTAISSVISASFTTQMLAALSNLPQLSTLGLVLLGPGFTAALNAMGLAVPAIEVLAAIGGLAAAALTIIITPISRFVTSKLIHALVKRGDDKAIPSINHNDEESDSDVEKPQPSTTHEINQSLAAPDNNANQGAVPLEQIENESAEEDSAAERSKIIRQLTKDSDDLTEEDTEKTEEEKPKPTVIHLDSRLNINFKFNRAQSPRQLEKAKSTENEDHSRQKERASITENDSQASLSQSR